MRLKESLWWASPPQPLKLPGSDVQDVCEGGVEEEQEDGQQWEPVAPGRNLVPAAAG